MVRLQLPPAPPIQLLRDGVISNSSLFESEVDGANPSPAANQRPVVKQHHVWPTPRNRGGRTFPDDHFELPRGVIRSAPVSDTGGPGAEPGEATSFISTKHKHLKRGTQSRCANI